MKKIYLNVKPFQETLHSHMCGPASLKIVLDYYGITKTEKELAQITDMISDLGIDERGIEKAAKMLGFNVTIKNESTFDDIETWLQKGVPLIVDWFTRGRSDYPDSEVADGHYSVIVGLDDEHIYLQDPEIGDARKIKRKDFLLVWFDFRGYQIEPNELIIRQLIAIYK
jgi:predicted double-glycine peptidase